MLRIATFASLFVGLAACGTPTSADTSTYWIAGYDRAPNEADENALRATGGSSIQAFPIARSIGFRAAPDGVPFSRIPGVKYVFLVRNPTEPREMDVHTESEPAGTDSAAVVSAGGVVTKVNQEDRRITVRIPLSGINLLSSNPNFTLVVIACDCSYPM